MSNVKLKYHSTQAELYVIVRIILRSFLARISDFFNFKNKYVGAFYTARIAQLDAAVALPDDDVRKARIATKRVALETTAETARNRWQDLKSYIMDAFTEDLWDIKFAEAGGNLYNSAMGGNWEDEKEMLIDGENFIATYSAQLLAGGNMPAGFPTLFSNAKSNFETKLDEFYTEEETASTTTDDKVTANNDVYDEIIQICIDGQKIFRDSPALKDQFTFDFVKSLVSNPVADLKGEITTGIASDLLEGFEIRIIETDEFVFSDSDGRYDFGILAAGNYTARYSRAGFVTQEIPVVIVAGVTKKVDVVMVRG